MSALTAHDNWLQSPVADDPAMCGGDEDVIEQMVAEPDCFDEWLSHRTCPPSVAGLLSLLLDRGLPRMDKSERDDELRDRLDAALDAVQRDFREWAETPVRHGLTPVGAWVDDDRV